MKLAKRMVLFFATNLLVVVTISLVLNLLGLNRYITAQGLDYNMLMGFCLVWGFAGAFFSLAISRLVARWAMGVQIIEPSQASGNSRWLVDSVHRFARQSGISTMPQVGIYESPELNAFATGPTRNRALVAVSTGLLHRMNQQEVEGVLSHEVAHIANGDMVTMALIQGVVNAFVMFFARVIGFAVSQTVQKESSRPMVNYMVTMVMEILLSFLGMIVVAYFSRVREYRADEGGAQLAGKESMIAALQALKMNLQVPNDPRGESLASLKISGKRGGFMALFSTHPALDDRIEALKSLSI